MCHNKVFWFLLLVCHFRSVWNVEYYESVQWTPQNPKFQFSKDDIQDGKAFCKLSVIPTSQMIVICPHQTTYMENEQQAIPNEQRYEAVWYVDKQSFHDCKVGKREGNINAVWLHCDTPDKLKFNTLVFQRFSTDSLVFPPGSEHYFIGTSDGRKDSLNSTSGGHCDDVLNGVSMKMMIYVCANETDPACNEKTEPPTTEVTESTTGQDPATQAARKSASSDIWHLLTIILGISIAVSLMIHSLCLVVVCRRRTKKKPIDKAMLRPETDKNGVENIQLNTNNSHSV